MENNYREFHGDNHQNESKKEKRNKISGSFRKIAMIAAALFHRRAGTGRCDDLWQSDGCHNVRASC